MTDIFRQQAAGEHPFAICAWLECDLEIDELAEHLARFLCGPGPDGGKVMWRFYDPRALAITTSLFSQEQLEVLMGPIKSWRFTWCRHWWSVSPKFDSSVLHWDSQRGWPTEQQWPSIQKSRLLNNVMNDLGSDRKLTADECLKYQQAFVVCLEECTRLLNIADEDDQFEFIYLCIKYGVAYRRHPKLAAEWGKLKDGKISWTDLRFQLSAADLDRLDSVLDS
jgi:hypothetical protein